MRRTARSKLLLAVLVIGLLALPVLPAHASQDSTYTVETDSGPIQCVQNHAVKHINDVTSSIYYYIISYPEYGIWWIVLGVDDTLRCSLPPN